MSRSHPTTTSQDADPRSESTPRARGGHGALAVAELLTGGSALVCGGLLFIRPDGSLMRLPLRVLEGSPFVDWRLPGMLLSGLVGAGHLTAGISERSGYRHSSQLSALAGTGLVVFEAVEWRWLGFHPLQAVFIAVGIGVSGLAVRAGAFAGHRPPERRARIRASLTGG
jgi:hypothetical protein